MKSSSSTVSNRDTQPPETIYGDLLEKTKTLHMATVDENGIPSASYAPFVRNENGCFNVYISQLSKHTRDLLQNPYVSIMVIEDERDAHQLYARTRATFFCNAQVIERSNKSYESILEAMELRFGNIVETLSNLPDFVLYELVPDSGRLVIGFGQAFDLSGDKLQHLEKVKPNSV